MKRAIISLLVLATGLGCGESEEDIQSRTEISSISRQIKGIYRDIRENKSSESTLNRLSLRNYYGEYTSDFRELRQILAAKQLSEKFIGSRTALDSIITQSMDYVNFRYRIMNDFFICIIILEPSKSAIKFNITKTWF